MSEVEIKQEINLEELPFHELRSLAKEQGIEFKSTDKKADIIKMLKLGETIHKPKPKPVAPRLEKKEVKVKTFLPRDIEPQLREMEARGMNIVVNESDNTVKFDAGIPVTCNLDSSSHAILRGAKESFRKALPIETSSRKDMF